jgi:hypothetical protein
MRYILWRLFGWSSFTMRQMDEIRANWFSVGESFGMNKTIDHIQKLGYTDLAYQLRTEMENTNKENGITTIKFTDLKSHISHAMDNEK